MGQVLAGKVPDATGQELTEYLRGYVALEAGVTPQAMLSALVLYYRYPLFAVLLGFASIGVALLPCLTAAFGFSLSFSVLLLRLVEMVFCLHWRFLECGVR